MLSASTSVTAAARRLRAGAAAAEARVRGSAVVEVVVYSWQLGSRAISG